jgi:2-oxo-4-hydroxy-4-carboxy-5-ureidoimidazoline decarboxylase
VSPERSSVAAPPPGPTAPVSPGGALRPIEVLDALPADRFETVVAPLFEGAPAFLGRLADARPFGSVEALFAQARTIAHAMPVAEQIELIDAHPRLGAPPGSVSAASFVEQGYDRDVAEPATDGATAGRAGITAGTDQGDRARTDEAEGARTDQGDRARTDEAERARIAAELDRLNRAYEDRFGFRYCVFVAGRPRAALLPQMAAALEADRDAEIARALDAVVDIAMDRYARSAASSADPPRETKGMMGR